MGKRKNSEKTSVTKTSGGGAAAAAAAAKPAAQKAKEPSAKKAKTEEKKKDLPPARKPAPKDAKEEEEEVEEEEAGSAGEGYSDQDTTSGSDPGSDGSDPENDDEDEEESEDDEDGEKFKEVQVDLGLNDVEEGDFHGIKSLVANMCDGGNFDSSGLADDIIAAKSVQSMIKTDDKEAPIGLISLLNIKRFADKPWLQQLSDFLLEHCPSEGPKEDLRAVLRGRQAASTGLVLTERLVNCPPHIAGPLLQMFEEELNYAEEDDELPADVRASYKVSSLLFVSRAYVDPALEAEAEAGPSKPAPKKGKKKGGAGAAIRDPGPLEFARAEDEFLYRAADWVFHFTSPNRKFGSKEVRPVRLVMLVGRDRVEPVREDLERYLATIVL